MLTDFIDTLEGAESLPAFEQAMQAALNSLGFDHFTYVALRVPGSEATPYFVNNVPLGWVNRYADKNYVQSDPVLMRALNSLRPFDWGSVAGHPDITASQLKVMTEAAEHGLPQGVSVPVHAPRGGFAVMSCVARSSRREFEELWRASWADLHLMALYFHSALERNLLSADRAAPARLTDREREAIAWTAAGKTAWETSEIMKISQETVNFHLKNVMRKLSVYSKHHAVVKAIMLGLIIPETTTSLASRHTADHSVGKSAAM